LKEKLGLITAALLTAVIRPFCTYCLELFSYTVYIFVTGVTGVTGFLYILYCANGNFIIR